jgi:hypothetical protein
MNCLNGRKIGSLSLKTYTPPIAGSLRFAPNASWDWWVGRENAKANAEFRVIQ